MRALLTIAAGAIAALAVWPVFGWHRAPAAIFTPAPVVADYRSRDRLVAFYEKNVDRNPRDQIQMRMLAAAYMQRFRERYDAGDLVRAQRLAQRSIALQPSGNAAAQMTLASARLSYHDFAGALDRERRAWRADRSNPNPLAQIASLQMELGRYGDARTTLAAIAPGVVDNPTIDSIRARYDELNGRLGYARELIDRAIRAVDSSVSIPAYDRSWFHLRAGQLAFEAGDLSRAEAELATAVDDFPDNATALMWQARLFRAQKQWAPALAAAAKSADLYPVPQVLGYKADAQRALGDAEGAKQTDALIDAEQRLFNANGVNDRLLANYYAQRRRNLDAALRAARSDYARRGDEVYADDSMAWVLAAMGRWTQARVYAERAVRLGTEDAQLQYHAAIVALHTGHRDEARMRLERALARSERFDPFESDDARARLKEIARP
jgi:tetratricopeptide (TPR) repeat protein